MSFARITGLFTIILLKADGESEILHKILCSKDFLSYFLNNPVCNSEPSEPSFNFRLFSCYDFALN